MSMSASQSPTLSSLRAPANHQSDSWLLTLLTALLRSGERRHQREQLRELADDPHRLSDLGLAREQVLAELSKPFWH